MSVFLLDVEYFFLLRPCSRDSALPTATVGGVLLEGRGCSDSAGGWPHTDEKQDIGKQGWEHVSFP